MEENTADNSLRYWQNNLFASILTYTLPFSILAIVPGVLMSLRSHLAFLAVLDSLSFFILLFLAFTKTVTVRVRKVIFIALLYTLALALLYSLGLVGPGLLYVFAATIFTMLILPLRAAVFSIVATLLVCAVFGLLIYFYPKLIPHISVFSMGYWIAVSSNLILLSSVIVILIRGIFNGFQVSLEKQNELKISLNNEQISLKKTIDMVNRKNKELEEFAYMTSHDLQEPLRMVKSFLGLLENHSRDQLDDKSRSYLQYAKDGAERMKATIADLLAYSLAESQGIKREAVDVSSIIKDYIDKHADVLKETKAVINYHNLPVIHADKLSMQQLFQNLLGNALKYQTKKTFPIVLVNCREDASFWQISITDNGIGIPENQLKNIFVIFKRLHDNKTYPGTGIGLAICKKIVEKHSGRIWAVSKPGEGSTFYFTLSKSSENQ